MKNSKAAKITIKRCDSCYQVLSVSQFYRSNTRYYQRECKKCNRDRKYRWYQTDNGKLSSTNTKLKRRFGITVDDYDKMLFNQNGMCLICGKTRSTVGHKLAVDHCHKTGKIRGLLCKECNIGLGNFYENPDSLRKAANYIEERSKWLQWN